MAKRTKADREASLAFLKSILDKNSTVSTNVVRVARDGMSRTIQTFAVKDGEVTNISRQVADVIGWRYSNAKGGVVATGCGMDMGFHIVYVLSRTIFSDCEDSNSGYFLKQKWM